MARLPMPHIAGAVPVLVMPFDDDGQVDEESLRRELDFCLDAASSAICFGMGSESNYLTDAERVQVWTLAARRLNGRLPLIVATAHASREGVLALTRLARDCGVDCAMVNAQPLSGDRLVALFRDLSERIGLPLMIQDAAGNAPAAVLMRAAQEAPAVGSMKLESPGAPLKMAEVAAKLREQGWLALPTKQAASAAAEDRQISVLGGSNGNLLPEELENGSVGTMPQPGVIDAFGHVCAQYTQGDGDAGYATYIRLILPLLRATTTTGSDFGGVTWLHKELLRRAGVLQTAYCRMPFAPLPERVTAHVLQYLDQHADELLLARRIRQANAA